MRRLEFEELLRVRRGQDVRGLFDALRTEVGIMRTLLKVGVFGGLLVTDVAALVSLARDCVRERFEVDLQHEVELLGPVTLA